MSIACTRMLSAGGEFALGPNGQLQIRRQQKGVLNRMVTDVSWWTNAEALAFLRQESGGFDSRDAEMWAEHMADRRLSPWATLFVHGVKDAASLAVAVEQQMLCSPAAQSFGTSKCELATTFRLAERDLLTVSAQPAAAQQGCAQQTISLHTQQVTPLLAAVSASLQAGAAKLEVQTLDGIVEECWLQDDRNGLRHVLTLLNVSLPLSNSQQWCGLDKIFALPALRGEGTGFTLNF